MKFEDTIGGGPSHRAMGLVTPGTLHLPILLYRCSCWPQGPVSLVVLGRVCDLAIVGIGVYIDARQ